MRSSAGHVDRLHRGHRAVARRGDALLQLAHLGLQRRLVAHLGGHAAEERGDLRAGLHEPEDVVDEEQHVLARDVAEVLRHRQAGQRHAHARAGRLVHLAEDEHRLVDDARLLHLQPEVVALAGALADAAEGGQAAVLLGEVVDELLDEDRLADAGAAEQADLAALGVRREEVDDLDAGLEHLLRRGEVLDVGGGTVDRPALLDVELLAEVDGLAQDVEDAPEGDVADGTVIGPPVSTTSTPRARPSVLSMATARRRSSPRCCCTSRTRSSWPSRATVSALLISGRFSGNTTSTTTPWISSIWPTLACRRRSPAALSRLLPSDVLCFVSGQSFTTPSPAPRRRRRLP